MTMDIVFRPYSHMDHQACLALFDANCPEFFASNERDDYASFLAAAPDGYEVCLFKGAIAGAFGLIGTDDRRRRLNWIMLDPSLQGHGIGSAIMNRVTALAASAKVQIVDIAASHKSAPFFAKFGAATAAVIEDGWGAGMHRVDMELPIRDR